MNIHMQNNDFCCKTLKIYNNNLECKGMCHIHFPILTSDTQMDGA